jgi:hypothetical protein
MPCMPRPARLAGSGGRHAPRLAKRAGLGCLTASWSCKVSTEFNPRVGAVGRLKSQAGGGCESSWRRGPAEASEWERPFAPARPVPKIHSSASEWQWSGDSQLIFRGTWRRERTKNLVTELVAHGLHEWPSQSTGHLAQAASDVIMSE